MISEWKESLNVQCSEYNLKSPEITGIFYKLLEMKLIDI